MGFLGWLDKLNSGIDKALRVKSAVDTVLNSAQAGRSVTKPIKEAFEFVKGLGENAETTEGGETPETPKTHREE